MRRHSSALFLLLALVSLCPAEGAAAAFLKGAPRDCRCVPDQWEGTIMSTEREFQMVGGGQALKGESSIRVHYDFNGQLLATIDVATGMKSIEDYRLGLKYTTDERGKCRVISIQGTPMERMCIPDEAIETSEFRLSADSPVVVWQWTNVDNFTRTTAVDGRLCLPVSEETYFVTEDYAELVSYLYVNVSLGIGDVNVFQPELSCRLLEEKGGTQRLHRNNRIPNEQ